MNVEFCKENSGSAQKMRYFRKIKGVGGGGGGGRPLGPSPGSATENVWLLIVALNSTEVTKRIVGFRLVLYTAISINVVGLKLQTFESRPNGCIGIYWNLHVSVEDIYKFVFLHVEYLFFFP